MMKPARPMAWLGLALCGVASAASPSGESPSLRALSREAELVVRGTALDQERAPGGLWHRFQVLEVIWPPSEVAAEKQAEQPPGDLPQKPLQELQQEPIGPTLRIFAHGAGVPEGADLVVGAESIVGLRRIPPPSESSAHPFARRLWEGFRPDRPGERPCVVAPDGVVPLEGRPDLTDAVSRLVRTIRDPSVTAAGREAALLDLAAHALPSVREEAVRQLSSLSDEARAAGADRLLDRFEAELTGPAHPAVLAAHLDLAASLGGERTRPLIAQLLRGATNEELSARAAAVLADRGEPGDLDALAFEFVSTGAAIQVRVLDALGRRSRPEALHFFSAAARSPHLAVRLAAARALGRQPPAEARPLLDLLRDDPEPVVSRAAAEEESFLSGRPSPARAALPFDAARKRLLKTLKEGKP